MPCKKTRKAKNPYEHLEFPERIRKKSHGKRKVDILRRRKGWIPIEEGWAND